MPGTGRGGWRYAVPTRIILGYAGHQRWATELAAGYVAALAVYHAAATEEPLMPQEAQQLRAGTVVVPAGQLAEWVLDELEEETSDVHG